MADGRIVIDAKIDTKQAVASVATLKKKANEIAAEFQKQGMTASDAMRKAWQQITNDAISGASKTKSSVSGINLAFKSLGSTVSRLGGLLASVLGPIALIALVKQCIELGSAVNEVQNVVDTAFGSMAYKMEAFAKNSITQFGMSQLAAKKTGSSYMAMARGMGISQEAASDMALTLTGLSGDVASFYNISQEEAAKKLESVFTGETEALRQLGPVMSQANLQQYALSQGITKSVSSMTQQEQAMLRYNFVLNALSMASGDFLKTQDSWANQTRQLAQNIMELGANIGSILTTVLTPAVKVLNDIVANLVHATSVISAAIVSLFGGQVKQNTAIAGSASAAADAENELAAGITGAANAAKKAQAGFDELNILQSDTGGGGSGGASGGIGSTSTSSETSYEEGEGLDTAEIERAAEIIKKIADWVPVIAATLGGLKLGGFIADLVTANTKADTLKGTIALLGKKAGITIGVTLAIAGIALEGKGIADAISQGLNGINFAEILGGSGALILGGTTIGASLGNAILGGAITGIIAGIPMFVTGVYESFTNGITPLSAALTMLGSTMAGTAIGAIIGGPAGAAIGALVGLVTGALANLAALVAENWDKIVEVWNQACSWFDENVIQPVSGFFSGMWDSISGFASDAWEDIKSFFSPAAEWFSELFGEIEQTIDDIFYNIGVIAEGCWEVIEEAWRIASNWFDENVIQPISDFFSGMWDEVKSAASDAWEGIKTVFSNVASFFGDIFSEAWEKVVGVFSVAGDIFVDVKEGILTAFKEVVNGIITGINNVVAIPFNGINSALSSIKYINIMGLTPFSGLQLIHVPQIPYLAQGAVLPPNKPFMAVVGDQKHGTNVEAPLATIQEAVAQVMKDNIAAMLAGFEALLQEQQATRQTIAGIKVGDTVIGQAAERYRNRLDRMRGGL